MRAITFHGVRDVHCEQVPDPALESPGDVIVRVERTAVCGSDLHVFRGAERGLDPGTVLGHEFLGEVVEVGADAGPFAPGDRVVSPFTTSCGDCFYCQLGLTARCVLGQLFGWVEGGVGLHGAQAELVRVPLARSTLLAVPAGVDPDAALFVGDVLATGMFCAELAGVEPGTVAAVLGCGPVGLMAIVAARERGAGRVFAVDAVAERLELARGFGAEPLALDDAPHDAVRAATAGRGADAVLEVVGSAAATRLAIELVRPGGTIGAVGVHTEAAFAFTPGEAYDKNLTYRAGRCPARAYAARALAIAASARHDLARVISHRLPLEAGPDAYDRFDRKLDGCTKVVLTP